MRGGLVCVALLASANAALAQPRLRAENPVVNGASYSPFIAPGSIFVVFGTNLAGESVVLAPSLPLGTSLGGVSIRFTPAAGGAAIDALMVYTTRNQIAGLLPSSAAPGDYNVTVTYNNQTSAPGRARVIARSIGIVTADASGSGQAQAQIYYSATEWALNRFSIGRLGPYNTAVARPGETLVLWGTGLGADEASDRQGGVSGDQTAAARVRIRIGGQEYTPLYAGRASQLPGTDQFNFILRDDVPTGCSVPVQVVAEGTASNIVTLAIAPRGETVCRHPFLTAERLRQLSEGGDLVMGYFWIAKSSTSMSIPGLGTIDQTSESVGGSFDRYGVGNLAEFGDYGGEYRTQIGQCMVARFRGEQIDIGYKPRIALDAGNPLRLNGPNANNIAVERDAETGTYFKSLYEAGLPGLPGGGGTPVVAAGTYRLTGPGGNDVGPFEASVSVPAPFVWTNRDGINDVTRSQGLALAWSGGAGVMIITGVSARRIGGTPDDPDYDGAAFVCFANAGAGNFTVPASILSQLPESGDIMTGGGMGFLSLSNSGPVDGGRFNAPLRAGGQVEHALFHYDISSSKMVRYR